MQPLLNSALKGDSLDKILSISIFSTSLKEEEVSFGRRGIVYRGSADVTGILRDEIAVRNTENQYRDIEAAQIEAGHIREVTGKLQREKGKMLVMVSGISAQRRVGTTAGLVVGVYM